MIIHSDCILAMAEMEPSSVDAIVTDPPYGLEFMGKEWDAPHKAWDRRDKTDGENEGVKTFLRAGKNLNGYTAGYSFQTWVTQWASEALRVLKPGGSLLSFGGTRTFHRLTCGLEDSGFIIKDCLMWLYGQGFPKAQDLGKMIDKRLGFEREVAGANPNSVGRTLNHTGGNYGNSQVSDREAVDVLTLPTSDLARHWDGYKIGGIKPAWEPIIWAVKPPEGSWTDNVLKYGTGAVNVDECRVAVTDKDIEEQRGRSGKGRGNLFHFQGRDEGFFEPCPKGRFPANLILDESAARLLDEQSGDCKTGGNYCKTDCGDSIFGKRSIDTVMNTDNGAGASRFFYTSKATDRDDYNDHPTLKPTDLIEWLIRLVTRPGQLVLDPFAGSGTTGVAAIQSGREFILIEQDEHYCEIAERRTSDGAQEGMF